MEKWLALVEVRRGRMRKCVLGSLGPLLYGSFITEKCPIQLTSHLKLSAAGRNMGRREEECEAHSDTEEMPIVDGNPSKQEMEKMYNIMH